MIEQLSEAKMFVPKIALGKTKSFVNKFNNIVIKSKKKLKFLRL